MFCKITPRHPAAAAAICHSRAHTCKMCNIAQPDNSNRCDAGVKQLIVRACPILYGPNAGLTFHAAYGTFLCESSRGLPVGRPIFKMNTTTIAHMLVNALYILALINPISKVSILFTMSAGTQGDDFRGITNKSSVAAAAILIGAMVFGDFLLGYVFRIEMHSMRLAGGLVLSWIGFNALSKGVFFEQPKPLKFEDAALVPLACPMIAGPATITACIALQVREGFLLSAISVALAVLINHVIMRLSQPIGKVLTNFNIMGALIRLTGLVVMTIGTQMALDGLAEWRMAANNL